MSGADGRANGGAARAAGPSLGAWSRAWPVAVACALPLAARLLSYTDRILDRDEAYWMASALRMHDLDVPLYVAGWDTKPPLPFLLHRMGLAVLPGTPMLGAHVVAALLAAAACGFVAAAARRLAGTPAALLAALAFALLDSTGPVRSLAANSELASYVPLAVLVWAVAALPSRSAAMPLTAGACAVAATMAKLPALVYAPASCVAILLASAPPRPWVRVPLFGIVGAGAAAALTAAGLVATGAWDDFYACNVTMSLHRAEWGMAIAESVRYDRWFAVAMANVPALAGIAVVAVMGAARAGSCRRTLCAVGPLVAAGIAAAFAGGAAFPHYLQLAWVPVAVVAGVGLAEAATWLRFAPRRVAVAMVAAAAVVAALPDRLGQWRSRDWAGYDRGPIPALRARVQALVPPGGTLFVWGIHPDLYVTCRRAPATRFISAGWLVGTYSGPPLAPEPFEFVPGSWDLLFADLERHRPEVVVDSVRSGAHGFGAFPVARFPRLDAWLRAGYVEEPGPGGYVIWRRR